MSTPKDWKAVCYDPLCEIHNPTTGEWTAERLESFVPSLTNRIALCEEINAALAEPTGEWTAGMILSHMGIKIATDETAERAGNLARRINGALSAAYKRGADGRTQ